MYVRIVSVHVGQTFKASVIGREVVYFDEGSLEADIRLPVCRLLVPQVIEVFFV